MNLPLSRLKGACWEQMALVQAEWPEGIPLTKKAAVRAAELGLDFDWAARTLLPAPAWAEYEKVVAAALAEYEKVVAAAWAEYEKVVAPALAEYEKVVAAAWAEYKKVQAAAWAEYKKVRAAALLALLLKSEKGAKT
jgi:hypothetical protein